MGRIDDVKCVELQIENPVKGHWRTLKMNVGNYKQVAAIMLLSQDFQFAIPPIFRHWMLTCVKNLPIDVCKNLLKKEWSLIIKNQFNCSWTNKTPLCAKKRLIRKGTYAKMKGIQNQTEAFTNLVIFYLEFDSYILSEKKNIF